jgi:ABC-type transport system involved in multi-copper enzyme maturation permease subunit
MLLELVRKKDIYVLFILLFALMYFLSSRVFFGVDGSARYVKDMGYVAVMFFSFLIAVVSAARQMPQEVRNRTIYPLLAKPVSRGRIMAGKFAGTSLVSFTAFSLFYAVFFLFCVYRVPGEDLLLHAQAYFSGLMFLSVSGAIALFLSSFLTVSANVTIMVLFYLVSTPLSRGIEHAAFFSDRVISALSGSLFYIIPHLGFYDMRIRLTHSWQPLSLYVISALFLYTLVYSAFLVFMSGIIFSRKRL